MKTFLQWLITSSENPTEISRTVRGVLVSIAPAIMLFTGLAEPDVQSVIDAVILLLTSLFGVIGAWMTISGALRKVKLGRWSAK